VLRPFWLRSRRDHSDAAPWFHPAWPAILALSGWGYADFHGRRASLAPRGALVITGGEGGGRWLGGTDRQLRAMMLSPFVGQKLGTFVNKENHEDLIVLKELVESGKITPVIDRTYPLAEVPSPSGIWNKDTPEEKSSSPCETNPKGLFTEVPGRSVLRRSFAASCISRVHRAGLNALPPVRRVLGNTTCCGSRLVCAILYLVQPLAPRTTIPLSSVLAA
jgi:Zinc-binding dehydrogenase